jgi:glucokinase
VARLLAIDIGGTKIDCGLVDGSGALVASERVATPALDADRGEALFEHVASLAARVRSDVEIEGIGVGCGGPMTRDGEAVSPLNIPAWRSFPLRSRLAAQFGVPVFVDNDAKALALAEGWLGAAVGCRDFIAMVVSTGIGGGIVVDGRLLDGADGNAGHIGHVIVEPGGRFCACRAFGCLEAEASGTAIREMTGRAPADAPPDVIARTGLLVGRAVGSVVNLLDIRLAVIGGSVALGFGEPFFAAAQDEVDRVARLSFSVGARVVPAGLGPDGPLVGAGAVGWRGLGQNFF